MIKDAKNFHVGRPIQCFAIDHMISDVLCRIVPSNYIHRNVYELDSKMIVALREDMKITFLAKVEDLHHFLILAEIILKMFSIMVIILVPGLEIILLTRIVVIRCRMILGKANSTQLLFSSQIFRT